MSSRSAIEQAKGMLMLHFNLTDAQAFAVLVRWSQARQVKVRVLAENMAEQSEAAIAAVGERLRPMPRGVFVPRQSDRRQEAG